jgi:hypothetical protein
MTLEEELAVIDQLDWPNETVRSIDDAPPMWRFAYRKQRDGTWHLLDLAAAEIEKAKDEMRTRARAHFEELKRLDAVCARRQKQLEDLLISRALCDALVGVGFTGSPLRAAEATLRQRLRFGFDGDHPGTLVPMVETPFGAITVATAVGDWLETEEGRSLQTACGVFKRKPKRAEGEFSSRIGLLP